MQLEDTIILSFYKLTLHTISGLGAWWHLGKVTPASLGVPFKPFLSLHYDLFMVSASLMEAYI